MEQISWREEGFATSPVEKESVSHNALRRNILFFYVFWDYLRLDVTFLWCIFPPSFSSTNGALALHSLSRVGNSFFVVGRIMPCCWISHRNMSFPKPKKLSEASTSPCTRVISSSIAVICVCYFKLLTNSNSLKWLQFWLTHVALDQLKLHEIWRISQNSVLLLRTSSKTNHLLLN